jgi:excisionase family DNA binding protein
MDTSRGRVGPKTTSARSSAKATHHRVREGGCTTVGNGGTPVPVWAQEEKQWASGRRTPAMSTDETEIATAARGSLPALLTVADVARGLRVSPKTVRRMIISGQLRAIRVRRVLRVAKSEYERFIGRVLNP